MLNWIIEGESFEDFLRKVFLPRIRLETHFLLLDGDDDE